MRPGCNLLASVPREGEFRRGNSLEMPGIAAVRSGTDPELRKGGRRDPMLTNAASLRQAVLPGTTQKVVIVNGSAEILELLETVLDAGHYDVVFVESSEHAYSQIKRVQPNLVILCVRIDDAEGLQVLSMLKLDQSTRDIPVLTYTTEGTDESEEETPETSESEMFAAAKTAVWMN
jgi:PleD family two-component response regulator